jgi:hypothetical protein
LCADNASVERSYLSSAERPRGSINAIARYARSKGVPRQIRPRSSAQSSFDGSQARKSSRPGQRIRASVLTSVPTVDRLCPTPCEIRLITGCLRGCWKAPGLLKSAFTCLSARRRIGTYFLQRGPSMKHRPGCSNSYGCCSHNPMIDQAPS